MDNLLESVASLFPDLEEMTDTLQRKIELLKSRKDDVDEKLQNVACRSGIKRKREVEEWLDNVENIKKMFETVEQQVQQSSGFRHVFTRQALAEQLERMTREVTVLLDQSHFPSGVFLEVDESIDQLLLTSQPNGQAFQQNLNDIWTSLMDVSVASIGIYGMGGVGKTTLAKCVHDKLFKESTFSDHVYWVTVSQEFKICNLQSVIARELKIDFTCENDEGKRAAQLFQAFKKKERFVLILDDVWKQIDTCKIGIPSKMEGSKLVITSRSEEVCIRMRCQKIIKVNILSEQEALNLFWKTLDSDERSLEVEGICKKIVKRCGGLPLALITLAGSMRGVNDIHEWRDASERLKESCMKQEDMEIEVLPILLYSYQRLRDKRLQRCFLYCSLYPEDHLISRDVLIGNFISEELMERRLSWQAEVDQGHAILNQLERACLLESNSYGKLKMHDLIREMAIGITKDNPRYLVKAGLHLKELPEEQEWAEDLDKVSLMCNSIEKILPGTSPKCPTLSTLILRRNPLRLIPDCFFTHMCRLRTLDLSKTKIKSLPNSISDLEKLKALFLKSCDELESVPSLEKLKELRYLELSSARIEKVPQGMESLTNLKRLSLFGNYRLKMIPTGTLPRLAHLQHLELPDHLDAPIEEVEELKQLEVLNCRLNSVRDLNRLINSRRIDKPLYFYNITVGSREKDKLREGSGRCKVLYFGEKDKLREGSGRCKVLYFGEKGLMESSLDTDKNMLPQDIEYLRFFRSGLSGCLLDEFPTLSSARDLKECEIMVEDKLECIMRLEEEQQSSGVPFQSLESLNLTQLPNFIGLFKWEAVVAPLPPGTFSCLQSLCIYECGKIKKVFPQSLVHNFHNLECLNVKDCAQMEEIIEDDKNEGADITLPRLQSFYLTNLPQVKSIYKGKMICDSIENISLRGSGLSGCLLDKFPTLSSARNLKECTIEMEDKIECIMRLEEEQQSSGVPFQSLEMLKLTELPNLIGLFKWEAVAAPLPPGIFSCLRRLLIDRCDKIKKVIPPCLVRNFHNLQILRVMYCAQVEEIIEDDKNEGADITLPRLKALILCNLPQVKSICKGKMICNSIRYIWLGGIKNIKEFPLYLPLLDDGQLSHPPRLRTIQMDRKEKEWWESLEWPHHNAKNVLQHLVKFQFDDLYASESGEEEESQC